MNVRIEEDALGKLEIPADAYWGIHTERGRRNFTLSGRPVDPCLIRAIAAVKKAACQANTELKYVDLKKAAAIISACDEIMEGKLFDQFPLDALQGGAGTSTNMNLNEVIANRAIELLGGKRGEYRLVHPLEDVNLHQSTNDVYPTALKIAAIRRFRELSAAVALTQGALQKKEKEFSAIVKIGRTEMKEAVPMTLGAEFSAFAEALGRDRWRTFKCEERLRTVNIGGTAVGTGLAAPRRYIFAVIEKLRDLTGLGISRGENTVDQTANADAFVEVSGILKAHAVNLIKLSNDLRLLAMLGEIRLPAVQAGSSLMPGKVNPVITEAAIAAGMQVIANDALLTDAVSRGTLQISEFLPVVAHALLGSLDMLIKTNEMLAPHIDGITADPAACRASLDNSETLITAFVPFIGYDKALAVINEFSPGTGTLRDFLAKKLGAELVDRVLSPAQLTALGYDDENNA